MMPRTLPCLKIVSLCLLAHAPLAFAQQPARQTPPGEAPPRLERIEPGSDVPATTLPPKTGTRIIEKKQGGQVTEVEVQAGPSRYIMRPNVPAGNAQPGTAEAGSVRAPQWQVLEFDIGKVKKSTGEGAGETPAAQVDAPPPPPPAKK